jgi:hypothetical protein
MFLFMKMRFNIPVDGGDYSENTIIREDDGSKTTCGYLFARMEDNPFLNHSTYRDSFAGVDDAERNCFMKGEYFQRTDVYFNHDLLASCVDKCLWTNDGFRDGQRRELYVGVDPGIQDPTAIITLEKLEGIYYLREIFARKGMSFTEMRGEIESRICHSTYKMEIDQGAFAMEMTRNFEAKYPHVVEGVSMNAHSIKKMADALYVGMAQGKVKIPEDSDLFNDLLKAKVDGDAFKGGEKLSYERNAHTHADRFMALLLAYDAGLSKETSTPKFSPVRVIKRGSGISKPIMPKFNIRRFR